MYKAHRSPQANPRPATSSVLPDHLDGVERFPLLVLSLDLVDDVGDVDLVLQK